MDDNDAVVMPRTLPSRVVLRVDEDLKHDLGLVVAHTKPPTSIQREVYGVLYRFVQQRKKELGLTDGE